MEYCYKIILKSDLYWIYDVRLLKTEEEEEDH